MSNLEKTIAKAFLEMAEGLETGSFGPKPRIALTGMGSEHGEENAMAAAVLAWMTKETPSKRLVMRPRNREPLPMIMTRFSFPAMMSLRANPI